MGICEVFSSCVGSKSCLLIVVFIDVLNRTYTQLCSCTGFALVKHWGGPAIELVGPPWVLKCEREWIRSRWLWGFGDPPQRRKLYITVYAENML